MNTTEALLAKRIRIFGIVQGVGFRPFIYRIARQHRLVGEVSNSTFGVDIFVEGSKSDIDNFLSDIPDMLPPIACVDRILVDIVDVVGFQNFSIVESKTDDNGVILISPDVSVCDDCIDEIRDSKNRRYSYPFTNCTNCGPRYTIIRDTPYDRHNTSMSDFVMCSSCQDEYDDPSNRRFHAQPNACEKCGPRLSLFDASGKEVEFNDFVKTVSDLLKEGYIFAIKGLGGFHLVADATNSTAVARLRKNKKRFHKPFALMSVSIEDIRSYAKVNSYEEKLLSGFQRPIVLLEKKNNFLISGAVSPKNNCFGVMLPSTPLQYLIMGEKFLALVMTSGNLSGEPISIYNNDAFERLSGIVDYFLIHNRDILTLGDDSVLRYYGGDARMVRRSRGYAPSPIKLLRSLPSVMACGSDMKNTICFTRASSALISQHIGDLEDKLAYDFFQRTISDLKRLFNINPELVACDYHPDYRSTRYALSLHDVDVVKVQHHHAHIAACMAENQINGPVIGLAFDGTGMGNDDTIWGGEVLIVDYASFERVASLESVPMPGGSVAVREPWRMAISYLYRTFGESLLNLDIPFLDSVEKDKVKILMAMVCGEINSPYTSSMGRFFDGVAAIVGIRNKVTFEGQAAMEFEALSFPGVAVRYEFYHMVDHDGKINLIISSIVESIVADIVSGVSVGEIAAKFHNTLVSMFSWVCLVLRKRYGIKRVALSGGVFQNVLLLCGIKKNLEKNNFEVLTHHFVPFNDGGISLGQAVVAAYSKQ